MKKIMCIAGTRPEIIKMTPVIKELNKIHGVDTKFVWSGQHYDYNMSKIFFEELNLHKPDFDLKIGSDTSARQTGKIMIALAELMKKYRPDIIVAEGDTNTVVAASLTAVKENIPFAHVEAGLRSYDRNMPEEINRSVAGVCAELHFTPTRNAAINLTYEGIPSHRIHVTGNTIVDVIASYVDRKYQKQLVKKYKIAGTKSALLTLHRVENVDDKKNLQTLMKAMVVLKDVKIIFPIHPRTAKQLKKFGLYKLLKSSKNIVITEPLGYLDFLNLLCVIDCVMTDSGGVQEEAFTMQLPTITLRYNTERPETVWYGNNVLVGLETSRLVSSVKNILRKPRKHKLKIPNELGDGNAGKRIASIIYQYLSKGKTPSLNVRESGSAIHKFVIVRKPFRISDLTRNVWLTAIYNIDGEPVLPSKNMIIPKGYAIRLFGPMNDISDVEKIL